MNRIFVVRGKELSEWWQFIKIWQWSSFFRICIVLFGTELVMIDVAIAETVVNRVWQVGVKADIKPMGWLDANGTRQGFDIDFTKLLFKRLGDENTKQYGQQVITYEPRFIPVNTENRFSKLLRNEVDLLIATVSITPARQKRYRFSKPYYFTGIVTITHKKKQVESFITLLEKKIAVLSKSSTLALLQNLGNPNISLLNLAALLASQVPANKDFLSTSL